MVSKQRPSTRPIHSEAADVGAGPELIYSADI